MTSADEVGILIQDEFPIWYGGTDGATPKDSRATRSPPSTPSGCASAGTTLAS